MSEQFEIRIYDGFGSFTSTFTDTWKDAQVLARVAEKTMSMTFNRSTSKHARVEIRNDRDVLVFLVHAHQCER